MTRQLLILGTSVTLPDPAGVTDLAARFQEQGGQLADLETTLQALARPDAWGDWTGLAADAFGQSIGQLPAELGDVCDAYEDVASALRQYAGQLEPVVNSLSSLSFQAEDAEYTLAATQRARSQAIANGQDPAVITGWDIRVADAAAVVAELRGRLSRLLAELNALAAACTKQIKAAEPKAARKSLFGELESDFVRDVADPLARVAKEAVKLELEAGRLELTGAAAVIQALFIDPVTGGLHDATTLLRDAKHLDAEQWSRILGDVAGVLGIVALLPIPGVDVVAGLLALGFGGAAAATEWWATSQGEAGASYLDAGVDTVAFAFSGVGMVAKAGVAAEGLADGADAADSGENLWVAGLQRTFTPSGIEDSISDEDAPAGLGDFGQKLLDNVRDQVGVTSPSGDAASPAAVTIARVGWTADRLDEGISAAPDFKADRTESKVP